MTQETLPGMTDGATRVTGQIDPEAKGAEGAPSGEGGSARRSPDEILADRRDGIGPDAKPKRGPGRPPLSPEERARRKKESDARYRAMKRGEAPPPGGGEAPPPGDGAPPPPPPPPVDDFVPWTGDDFVGVYSGAFASYGALRYPEAPEPWQAIGNDPAPGKPSPARVMAERTATVANKWKLRLWFKEELQLLAAVSVGVYTCVMASEEIMARKEAEKRAKPAS